MANNERRLGLVPGTGLSHLLGALVAGQRWSDSMPCLSLTAFEASLPSSTPFGCTPLLIGRGIPPRCAKIAECDPILLDCWTLLVLDRHPQLCRTAWHLPGFGGGKLLFNGCNLTIGQSKQDLENYRWYSISGIGKYHQLLLCLSSVHLAPNRSQSGLSLLLFELFSSTPMKQP